MDDLPAFLVEVQTPTPALTSQDREALAMIAVPSSPIAVQQWEGNEKTQSHYPMQNYLPEHKWYILSDKNLLVESKCDNMTEFCVCHIELRTPAELAYTHTRSWLVVAGGTIDSPMQICQHVQTMKH